MNLRAALAAAQRWYANHSQRDRRIIAGIGAAVAVALLFVGVVDPLRAYRRRVAEEIAEGQDRLERAARFAGAIDSLRTERDDLKKRLAQANGRLLPGDSGTLGAAALQERANTLAGEKNISVLSTQVMKEEQVDPFRKVAVRLTLSGELKPFADFVSGLEYGPQQLTIPFLEVSRRGAVPGAKGPRTLSATVEVSGYLRPRPTGKDGAPEPEADASPAEGAAPGGDGAAPAEGAAAGEGGAPTAAAGGAAVPIPPPAGMTPPGVTPPAAAPAAVAGATPPTTAAGPTPPTTAAGATPPAAAGATPPSTAAGAPGAGRPGGTPPSTAAGNAVGAGKPGADTPVVAPKPLGAPAPPPMVPAPPPATTPGASPSAVPNPAAPPAAGAPTRP